MWADRKDSAIQSHWTDKISRDVKKFNSHLLRVFNSKPTGVTDQQKVNMAVAIHEGKIDCMSHRHKDFEARDWKHCPCWLALKEHRAFQPPSPNAATVDIDSDGEDDNNTGEDSPPSDSPPSNSSPSETDSDDPRALFATPANLKAASRGGGPGGTKTKALADMAEYRKKKLKVQHDILVVQQQKATEFANFVSNQARSEAFKMAAMGHNTFKDSDPLEAAKHKQTVNDVLTGNTAADMPPLPGASNLEQTNAESV